MSHQVPQGGIIVDEGDEHPSHLNMEGRNAQHTNAAGEALSGGSSRSEGDTDEKKGGGKPVMEKYAYHSEPIPHFSCLFHPALQTTTEEGCIEGANQ